MIHQTYRQRSIWFQILLSIFSISFLIVWLPAVRALFDGASYEWGMEYFGFMIYGAGINSHYLFIVAELLLFLFLFISVYWIQHRLVFHVLSVIWFFHFFGNMIFDIIRNGDTMFHGDTMNVHIPLTAIVIPLTIITAFVLIMAIRHDIKAPEVNIPWSRANNLLAIAIFGFLPIQFILLSTGEPHGITDQIGVVISLVQVFLIPYIFIPYPKRKLNLAKA